MNKTKKIKSVGFAQLMNGYRVYSQEGSVSKPYNLKILEEKKFKSLKDALMYEKRLKKKYH